MQACPTLAHARCGSGSDVGVDRRLNANLSSADLEKFKTQIQQLNATLVAVHELKEGDVMTFDLLPGAGTRISVNGQLRGTAIAGDDFHVALLKIWLGDNPVQAELKKALLGQT